MHIRMMDRSYTKYFTLLISFFFLCSSFSCSSPSPVIPIADEINDYLSDDWYHDLTNWMSLSYIEDDENACFSSYPVDSLESPDLYTTSIAIGILTNLGNTTEIPNKQSIVDWVESLRHEQGFYTDPVAEVHAPNQIDETRQAVEILISLEWNLRQKDSIIDFLLSLQKSDGLFNYNITPVISDNNRMEKNIAATNSAVITLTNLGFNHWEVLEKTAVVLQGYISERLNQTSDLPSMQIKETGSIILAIWNLTLIDRSLVSEQAEQFIRNSFKEIPHLSGDMLMVSRINNLLEAANALELEEAASEDTLKDLKEYLTKKIFPQQLDNGMFADSFMSNKVVRLANKINADIPNQNIIIETLGDYRIEAGWVPFVQLNMKNKAQHTYYALNILRKINGQEFDLNKLLNYLENILLSDNEQLQEIYYALISCRFINAKLNPNLLKKVEETSTGIAHNLIADFNHASDWGYFVLISEIVDFKISNEFESKIAISANQLKSKILEDNMYRNPVLIHLLYTISEIDTGTSLDSNEVNRLIMSFYCDSGGFSVGYPGAPADIHSTYLALQLLESTGLIHNVDMEKLINFILSCKSQYGFKGAADQSVEYPLMPELRSTYEALYMLDKYGYVS